METTAVKCLNNSSTEAEGEVPSVSFLFACQVGGATCASFSGEIRFEPQFKAKHSKVFS